MRLHARGFVAALLTSTLILSGCTDTEKKGTPTPTDISISASASAAPDPTTDIVIRGASFRRIIQVANGVMGTTVVARFVAKGTQEPCELLSNDFNISGDETMMAYCSEGYILMPEAIATDTTEWSTKPAMGIWYEVALDVVHADKAYENDILGASCAAAYVTTRKLNYQRKTDGEQLLKYLADARYEPPAIEYARKGLDAAADKKPVREVCKES